MSKHCDLLRRMPSVTVAEYLARRLHDAGVRHLFGVPGDFTLVLNEALAATGLLEWVGTAGELGAGYAADGYARQRGLAALVTTYGVGELSALGAIAGAYAEQVPILAITGAPATTSAATGAPLHHTLADGDFGHFERAYREVTVAAEVLTADGARAQIDRVLHMVRTRLRPGYLSVPVDVVDAPIDLPAAAAPVPADADGGADLAAFTTAVRRLLAERGVTGVDRPVVVAGHLVRRLRAEPALRALAEAGGLPVVTLVSAKGALDEDHPAHRGVYLGALGDPAARAVVDSAPAVITIGALWSDVVAGLFTHRAEPEATVALDLASATVAGEVFDGVGIEEGIAALAAVLAETAPPLGPVVRPVVPVVNGAAGSDAGPPATSPLTQAELWRTLERRLPSRCTVVTDIGTAFWGMAGITFPPDTVHLAQPLWSAIGYALPATLGAGLADPHRRPILITGEGAAMMTVQELGTLAARVPGAIVVVIDNGGYTIERLLRSPHAGHHDVVRWDWTALARAVAPDGDLLTWRVTTEAEFSQALDGALAAGTEKPGLSVVHAVTEPLDAPPLLRALAKAAKR